MSFYLDLKISINIKTPPLTLNSTLAHMKTEIKNALFDKVYVIDIFFNLSLFTLCQCDVIANEINAYMAGQNFVNFSDTYFYFTWPSLFFFFFFAFAF